MKLRFALIMILVTLLTAPAFASGLSSARATAMGGAYTSLAKGVYAPLYNPANIGLSGYQENGMELVGLGVQVSNNSFTLGDYNDYCGAVLNENDKSAILGKIPSDGLKISAKVQANVMSLSMGSLVFSTNMFAASEINLDRDILGLILYGNQFNDTLNVDGMYSDAIAYASVGLSYARPVYQSGTRQLSVGGTIKYIRGIAYEEITELNGEVATYATGFEGEGNVIAKTATGGSGYALDLGGALKLTDDYTVGIAFNNFLGSVNWNQKPQEHRYEFRMDSSVTIDNMDDNDVVISDDTTIDISSFKTGLPTVMTIGFAKISGNFNWAVDWEQGFRLAAGVSSKPRIAGGVEYRFISFLPVRAGYALGGSQGSTLSFGSGLDLSLFYLDFAFTNHGGISSSSSKGLDFAISTGLKF